MLFMRALSAHLNGCGAHLTSLCTLLGITNRHLMDAYSTWIAYWHNRCNVERIDRACLLLYTLDLSLDRAFLLRQVMNGLMALVTHLMNMMRYPSWNHPLAVIGATF